MSTCYAEAVQDIAHLPFQRPIYPPANPVGRGLTRWIVLRRGVRAYGANT